MSAVILRVSLDTLEVSLDGELAEGVAEELDALKDRAQQTELPQRFRDTQLFVQPKAFGMWRWRLVCPDYSVVLAAPSLNPGHRPSGQIRLSAFGLSTRDNEMLWLEATSALDALGEFFERTVSRLDVCADIQGFKPTQEVMEGITCPAVYRGLHLSRREVQTYQYGKGECVVRVYDKTAEILHSHKTWMPEVWAECAGYNPARPVTRIEAQMKASFLRELGITSSAAAVARGGQAFEYVLREWCQLRVPNGDKKPTRWPEHPVWTQLRQTVASSGDCVRARRKARTQSVDTATRRFIGLVAQIAANYGEGSYIKAVQLLSDRAEVHMITEHLDFADLVAEKRKRLEAEWGEPPEAEEPF